jgi:hypothetical protein
MQKRHLQANKMFQVSKQYENEKAIIIQWSPVNHIFLYHSDWFEYLLYIHTTLKCLLVWKQNIHGILIRYLITIIKIWKG